VTICALESGGRKKGHRGTIFYEQIFGERASGHFGGNIQDDIFSPRRSASGFREKNQHVI
jgi:hypothetical protein